MKQASVIAIAKNFVSFTSSNLIHFPTSGPGDKQSPLGFSFAFSNCAMPLGSIAIVIAEEKALDVERV
jgi:hypothetical protein